jgi:hypothetical protein
MLFDGVGCFNCFVNYRKTRGGFAIQIPHRDKGCCGVDELQLEQRAGRRLAFQGRALPMRFVRAPRTIAIDVAPLVGINAGLAGLCCSACFWVHDKLGIHYLDCLCCLGRCFACVPVPWAEA